MQPGMPAIINEAVYPAQMEALQGRGEMKRIVELSSQPRQFVGGFDPAQV